MTCQPHRHVRVCARVPGVRSWIAGSRSCDPPRLRSLSDAGQREPRQRSLPSADGVPSIRPVRYLMTETEEPAWYADVVTDAKRKRFFAGYFTLSARLPVALERMMSASFHFVVYRCR